MKYHHIFVLRDIAFSLNLITHTQKAWDTTFAFTVEMEKALLNSTRIFTHKVTRDEEAH